MSKITVIFPCYKESKKVVVDGARRVEELAQRFGMKCDVIVGQNGDPKAYKFRQKNISVCYLPYPAFGEVLRIAIDQAGGDYIYITSPDHPFGLKDLEQMLVKREEYDVLVGSKLHKDSVYEIQPLRKLSTKMVSIALKILAPGLPVSDPNGSLFFNNKVKDRVLHKLKANDFFISTELVYRAYKMKLKITEVPVTYIKSNNQSKFRVGQDGWKYLKQLLVLVRD